MDARVTRAAFALVLASALGLVVYLSRQSRELRAEVLVQRRRANFPRVGQYVPPLRLATNFGDSVTLGVDDAGSRQLLFVYQAKCGFCKADASTWNAVAARLATTPYRSVRVIGVSVDTTDSTAHRYASDHGFRFPIVRLPDPRWIALYHSRAVPLIVFVDVDGKLLFVRSGELGKRAGVDSLLATIKRQALPLTVTTGRGPVASR